MEILRRTIVIIETVFFFGPATLVLFASPILLFGTIGAGSWTFIPVLFVVVGGAFGLFVAFNLAAHILEPEHKLLSKGKIISGIVSGALACLIAMASTTFQQVAVIVCLLPIIGVLHLTWLCRRGLTNAA